MRYLHRMFAVVECMTAYPNTLGLALTKLMLVRRQTPLSESAPLMRAVACDVKRYMAIASEVRGQRILPLGFCTEKGGQTIDEFNYLTEGSPEERVDFFAVSAFPPPSERLWKWSDQAITSSTITAGSESPPRRPWDTTKW